MNGWVFWYRFFFRSHFLGVKQKKSTNRNYPTHDTDVGFGHILEKLVAYYWVFFLHGYKGINNWRRIWVSWLQLKILSCLFLMLFKLIWAMLWWVFWSFSDMNWFDSDCWRFENYLCVLFAMFSVKVSIQTIPKQLDNWPLPIFVRGELLFSGTVMNLYVNWFQYNPTQPPAFFIQNPSFSTKPGFEEIDASVLEALPPEIRAEVIRWGVGSLYSGQFITTSAEVTPNGGLVRESPPKWP